MLITMIRVRQKWWVQAEKRLKPSVVVADECIGPSILMKVVGKDEIILFYGILLASLFAGQSASKATQKSKFHRLRAKLAKKYWKTT